MAHVPQLLHGVLLPTFIKMVDRKLLIDGVPQIEDNFSIVRTNWGT